MLIVVISWNICVNCIKKDRGGGGVEAGTFWLVTRSDMLIARETFVSRGKQRSEAVSCFQKLKMSKQ
jgi:hypothetical protein